MRKTKCKTMNCTLYRRLAEIQIAASDRQSVMVALRDAEAIADAVIWVKDRLASLGAVLPKLGFRH